MGILGDILGVGGDGGASAALAKARQQYEQINTPDPEQMKVQLQQMVQAGTITPQQAQTIQQNPSMFNQVAANPTTRAAQEEALSGVQKIANTGGLTAADQAQLSQIQDQAQQAERGSREAITQNAQERGVGGSGLALAQQLENQQGSATRQSAADLGVAGQAQARALQALATSGQMGNQMETTDYNEQAQKAQAQDAINKFNAANAQSTNLYNTGTNNQAQYANLANKQDISNQNTGIQNQQQYQNKGVYQQDFNNKMGKAAGIAGQYGKEADLDQQRAASSDAFTGNIIGTVGKLAGQTKMFGLMNKGGIVPGRAKVHGDSPKNDVYPAKLSPGEAVIPRSVMNKFANNSANTPTAHPADMAAMLSALGHLRAKKEMGLRGI